MTVIGTFTVSASSFALAETLAAVPDATFEADSLVSHSTLQVMPFLWVSADDLSAVETALEMDETVESADLIQEMEGTGLFNVVWSDEFEDFVDEMVDHEAAIVDASARGKRWRLRLRFADEERVSKFQNHFQQRGIRFTVEKLHSPSVPKQQEFGLTADQREALVTAAREGYFDVPRQISATELGDLLGISANSASERVRRGSRTLIDATLMIDDH